MKHHLNTLFLTTQGTHLAKNGECIDIRLDGKSLKKIPVHTLHSVICFGQISCSPYLLDHCAQNSVSLSWFSEYGRFMASMQGPTKGNVLLRRAQYRMTDSPEQSAELARFFTIGKISNCRSLLMRQARTLTDDTLTPAIEKLARCLHQLKNSAELNIVRGDRR
jgi:CRISPR-associated protein Cas1